MSTVFLGCPTYNGQIDARTAKAIYGTATNSREVIPFINGGSLLASNCNTIFCAALNAQKEHNVKWFAMLHADVEPESFWLDKMIEIAEDRDADMLSACVPLKDDRGITSHGIGESNSLRVEYRLTQSQLHHESFPKTFDVFEAIQSLKNLPGKLMVDVDFIDPVLLLNTGCMIVRIDRDWIRQGGVWFSMEDWIENVNGMWRTRCFSEDWQFSQRVHNCGGKVLGTQELFVIHRGSIDFRSDKTWGIPNDCGHLAREATA